MAIETKTENLNLLDYVKRYQSGDKEILFELIYLYQYEIETKQGTNIHQSVQYRDKFLSTLNRDLKKKYFESLGIEEVERIFLNTVYDCFEKINSTYSPEQTVSFFDKRLKGAISDAFR